MDAARWRAVRELFEEVVDLAPALRARRLDDTARADPELHREVERLLAADAAAVARLAMLDAALGPTLANEAPAADLLRIVGRTVAHFHVVAPIASGGMGIVYRAEDTRLARAVALKLPLPHRLTEADARRRFLREGRAAGALDHPNVCAVHEVGETDDGQLYIAMALCPGETLRARLARDGAMPVADAVRIARDIALGLNAAHDAGIVHRDVKPGNVMLLPDGGVKVLDFGLARVRDLDRSASRTTAGTVAYMAPEQVRGEAAGASADLWALGVVLYEMLTGRTPFAGDHDAAVVYAIVHEAPTPLADLCPDIPDAVDAVVRTLLTKDPARRRATAREVATALEAALVSASAEPSRRRRVTRWRRRPRRLSVVLTVAALAASAAAGVPLIRQRAQVSTRPERATEQSPTSSREAYDLYLRGRDYERRGGSFENLDAARQLYLHALALDPAFALANARLSMVIVGMAFGRTAVSPAVLSQARPAAEAALRARPSLGEAHLALGRVWLSERQEDSAVAEFQRAAAAMPNDVEIQVQIGTYLRDNGRWQDALAHFERAAQLDSNDAGLLQSLALLQSRFRRYDAAVRTWDRLLILKPDEHQGALIRGWVYLRWLGTTDSLSAALRALPPDWDVDGTASWARFNVARIERHPVAELAAVRAMRPTQSGDVFFHRPRALLLAQAYADMGDRRRARAYFQRARDQLAESLAVHPRATRHAALGLALAGLGQNARAASEADTAMMLAEVPKTTPFAAAMMGEAAEIRARIGDVNGALALIERLLSMPAGRETSVATLRVDPTWDGLRADSRFQQLLARFAAEVQSSTGRPIVSP